MLHLGDHPFVIVRVLLVEGFSDSSAIVLGEPPGYHDFDVSVGVGRASLRPVVQHEKTSLLVSEPDHRVDWVVVPGHRLGLEEFPGGSEVERSLLKL